MTPPIRAVLFDNGDTLVRPIGGRWWPKPTFQAALCNFHRDFDAQAIQSAHDAAMEYLDANHDLQTLEEEVEQFRRFYEIVFKDLALDPPRRLIEQPANEAVYEQDLELYEEALGVVRDLKAMGLAVGIVSNAWPSLDHKYRLLGIRDEFYPFVISAQVASIKPDPWIYRVALQLLALPSENVPFVDDWPPNVQSAIKLGFRGVVISRSGARPDANLDYIADLRKVKELL